MVHKVGLELILWFAGTALGSDACTEAARAGGRVGGTKARTKHRGNELPTLEAAMRVVAELQVSFHGDNTINTKRRYEKMVVKQLCREKGLPVLPTTPQREYKHGWQGWRKFLGTER
eukprot:1189608-Prorocentrum_minimum.AAC.3